MFIAHPYVIDSTRRPPVSHRYTRTVLKGDNRDELTIDSNITKKKGSPSSHLARVEMSTSVLQKGKAIRILTTYTSLFAHKREFAGVDPRAGQPVSFVRTITEKGDAATKVREEESVPEPEVSDEGREFGKVKVCHPWSRIASTGFPQ